MFRLRRWKWWRISGVAFATGLALLLWQLAGLRPDRLSVVDQTASAVSGYATLASFVVSVLALHAALSQRRAEFDNDLGLRSAVLQRLASAMRAQGLAEIASRRIYQPVPLRVHWSSTGRPLAAEREVVLPDKPPVADWSLLPLQGDATRLVEEFRGLPHRQLVVIGEPGAGKTVLVTRMSVGLTGGSGDDPIPVLLPLASWNPTREHPQAFVARRLCEAHPFLAESTSRGTRIVDRLIDDGLILPILDGLDDLPGDWQVQAVRAIDDYAASGSCPFVLTCRSREYESAVMLSGRVLSRAAVVEIEPVGVEQAIEFLSHPASARQRWRLTLEHLQECPNGPLAKALATPLMVVLARTAYAGRRTDPSELLALGDPAAIRAALIDSFLKSVYTASVPYRVTGRTGAPRRREYTVESAERWLSCLAYHQYLLGTNDLVWWQLDVDLMSLRPEVNRRVVAVVVAAGAAAAAGVIAGLTAGFPTALWVSLTAVLVIGLNAARAFHSMWPDGSPPYIADWGRQSLLKRRLQRVRVHAGFGAAFGLVTGLLVGRPMFGVIAGLVYGLSIAPLPALWTHVLTRRAVPAGTLHDHWFTVAVAAIQHGLGAAVLFAAGEAVTHQAGGPLVGLVAASVFGLAAAFGAGLWTWISFRLAHAQLAMRGWLPWLLLTFLDDARQRDVLRQAGPAWQFRHALIQSHLAGQLVPGQLRDRADAGDWMAATQLADQLSGEGSLDALRARADAGDGPAFWRLEKLLESQGRTDEAIALLRVWADRGHGREASHLADLLTRLDRIDEAIDVLRAQVGFARRTVVQWLADLLAGEPGRSGLMRRYPYADGMAWRLIGLLADQGRGVEVLEVLRACTEFDEYSERAVAALEGHGQIDAAVALLNRVVHGGRRKGSVRPRDQNDAKICLAKLLARHDRIDELRALAEVGGPVESRILSGALARHGRIDELRQRADRGDFDASRELTKALVRQGSADELRRRADAGSPDAAVGLADLFAGGGDIDEAIAALRANPDTNGGNIVAWRLVDLLADHSRVDHLRSLAEEGDQHALDRLIHLLDELNQVDMAVSILSRRIEAGDRMAPKRIVELFVRTGRADDAVGFLSQDGHDDVDRDAAEQVVDLLLKLGRIDDAVAVLGRRAASGDAAAANRLADLHLKHGRTDDAVAVLRPHSGRLDTAFRLTDLLAGQGEIDDAIAVLCGHPRLHHSLTGTNRLADLLADDGRVDDLRSLVGKYGDHALKRLVLLLADLGRGDEATRMLVQRVDAGDRNATSILVDLFEHTGQIDDAVAFLRPRIHIGDKYLVGRLADLFVAQGRIDAALATLRPHAYDGNRDALDRWVRILTDDGRIDEALAVMAGFADGGDPRVSYDLATLLAEHGRIDDLRSRAEAGDYGSALLLGSLEWRAEPARPSDL